MQLLLVVPPKRSYTASYNQHELVIVTKNHNIYHLPCGDLCEKTCLAPVDYPPDKLKVIVIV